MNTQAVQTTQPTKLQKFQSDVLSPERKAEIYGSLPAHVRPERFERNLINALMQNPKLMDLDKALVFREVSKAAALGLYLDPALGEAYLIAGWNGKSKRSEPQLRIGYRGLVKLSRQSGEISMIYAHEVCKNDDFTCVMGDTKRLDHTPDVFGDRGPVIGYYAVVKYNNGETDFEPMSVDQINLIRDRSDSYQAVKAGKAKSSPWTTDETEMAKKTVIRRLVKRIPQSPELAEAIHIEDRAEHSEFEPQEAIAAPPPPGLKLTEAPKDATLELTAAEAPAEQPQAEAPPPPAAAPDAAPEPQEPTEQPAPMALDEYNKWMDDVDAQMGVTTTVDDLDEVYHEHKAAPLDLNQRQAFDDLYCANKDRIEQLPPANISTTAQDAVKKGD